MVRTYRDGEPFPGRVGTTLADSIPAWPLAPRAAQDAPNVLLIVLDDVGFAQLACFGSDLYTPNIDRLAARGLRYRNYHTTAMCSPTRACLMTGRNHHTCAIGGITDLAMGYPGFNGRIPKACGFVPEVLRQQGWATFAVGKWHLAPSDELHAAAPRDRWPLGQGFERFYGFMGGETNQYAPDLVIDNTPQRDLGKPDGYHLTEDLADHVIQAVGDLRAIDPNKPWFGYFALGACHAPHQAPPEWIERYRGRFDQGWDEWRTRIHAKQQAEGIIPPGAPLSERPHWVQDWETLPDDERRAFARMMEVFAGFLSHADHHIGRVLDFLEASGELDNTLVILCSDNGASAEGGPFGTFNENFVFNALPHDPTKTMELLDELGGPNTYGHYPWGWAYAGNTPFKRWKRETHEGGIGDPLIVLPPAGAADGGAVRSQYVHAIDVAATILDVCGVAMPATLNGVTQEPVAGTSFAASLRDGSAKEHRITQYYEQFACRAIYHDGWKAVAFHSMGLMKYDDAEDPNSPFEDDVWELYHVAVDPAETHDLAAAEPARLRALQDLWWREAGHYGALPLQSLRGFAFDRPKAIEARTRYVYRPGTVAVPEENAVDTKLRSHRIVADVELRGDAAHEGVVVAQGGKFGGYSLWLRDATPRYSYNFAGLETTTLVAPAPLPPGRHTIGVDVERIEATTGFRVSLVVDGEPVAGPVEIARTTPLRFTLAGEGLCCGYDDGTPVGDYSSPYTCTATIHEVVIDVSGEPYADVAAAIHHAELTQ